jgi:alanine racemase
MNRLGVGLDELDQFESLLNDSSVLMTHLACADTPEDALNNTQFKNFDHAWNQIGIDMQRSVLNSAGVFNFPDKAYDWVRPGIAMYGGIDFSGLKTAMTFRSQIISIQSLGKNERIGYGGRVKTEQASKIAIVYCGYADGFPQTAIDGTSVMVNSHRSQILGRVSMDLISIDITEIPDCKIGDWCELWSPELSILENTKMNSLLSYELMTKMSQRVKRYYLNI